MGIERVERGTGESMGTPVCCSGPAGVAAAGVSTSEATCNLPRAARPGPSAKPGRSGPYFLLGSGSGCSYSGASVARRAPRGGGLGSAAVGRTKVAPPKHGAQRGIQRRRADAGGLVDEVPQPVQQFSDGPQAEHSHGRDRGHHGRSGPAASGAGRCPRWRRRQSSGLGDALEGRGRRCHPRQPPRSQR